MAVRLGELPPPADGPPLAGPLGLNPELRVSEALALLAGTEEAEFARVVAAFFAYRRNQAQAAGGEGPC